jgi:uncharacterized SAM-binding protein YcdF (DUF218 family)
MGKTLGLILSGAAAAVAAWLAGFLWFAVTLPRAVSDASTHTDAIVVLTGGSERIDTGVRLLQEGLADRLYISGVGGQPRQSDALTPTLNDPAVESRIAIGTAATNTLGNAAETAAWAQANHVHSIRLVTAGYHMRRSLLELRAAMPDITIIPHPVFPAHVKSDWWRWSGTASLIAREYTKFVATWLRQRLGIAPEMEDALISARRQTASPAHP